MSSILLLEDDLSLINGLSFAFKKQGFQLTTARTLKEADALWGEGKYDLLVLDVALPDGTGFQFCKKVRQVSKVPIGKSMLDSFKKSVVSGDLSKVYGDSDYALGIYNQDNRLNVGDKIKIGEEELEIACIETINEL